MSFVEYNGLVGDGNVDGSLGARPSVSLKLGFSLVGDGDGTVENPYVVLTEPNANPKIPTYLNQVKPGSYVKYVGDSENGCDNTNVVNGGWTSCSGKNANYWNDTSMGYCYSSSYQFKVNGWRVGYIENDSAHLISAGATDCMCTNPDGTLSSSSCSYDTSVNQIKNHINNMDSIAIKYCNEEYAKAGVCDSTSAWAMDSFTFKKIVGRNINNNDCFNSSEDETCGYNNDLIDNGGYYFFGLPSRYSVDIRDPWYWRPDERYATNRGSYSRLLGVRPVLALDPSVRVIGGNGTYEYPYIISNYNIAN